MVGVQTPRALSGSPHDDHPERGTREVQSSIASGANPKALFESVSRASERPASEMRLIFRCPGAISAEAWETCGARPHLHQLDRAADFVGTDPGLFDVGKGAPRSGTRCLAEATGDLKIWAAQPKGRPDLDSASLLSVRCGAMDYLSVSASFAPSATNAAAKLRRIHFTISGRKTTWLRIAAAERP